MILCVLAAKQDATNTKVYLSLLGIIFGLNLMKRIKTLILYRGPVRITT